MTRFMCRDTIKLWFIVVLAWFCPSVLNEVKLFYQKGTHHMVSFHPTAGKQWDESKRKQQVLQDLVCFKLTHLLIWYFCCCRVWSQWHHKTLETKRAYGRKRQTERGCKQDSWRDRAEETTRENNQFSFFRRDEELMMIYSITH